MARYNFEREARTAHSECYTVVEDESFVGRLDLHYADGVVHCSLSISESQTTEDIQQIIDGMEGALLDSVGIPRQEMIVHVHQGRDIGVWSSHDFEGNGGNGGFQRMS